MKLYAEVEIRNLLAACLDQGPTKKWSKSCLSVGKKNPKDPHASLQICTQSNRNGTHYKLLNNVERVFNRFAREGKCTIRIRDPPVDILINKADPVSLGKFLNVVHICIKGDLLPTADVGILLPASSAEVSSLKKKLMIHSKREYPMSSNFPPRLEHLTVACGLKCVDTRILKLGYLRTLDLSGNNIKMIPECWDKLTSLVSLNLSKNQIECFPRGFVFGHLKNQLHSLDVSGNLISFLPSAICNFSNLLEMKLSSNKLKKLPQNILTMPRLTTLDVSNNELEFFSGKTDSLRKLDFLNLTGNEALFSETVSVNTEGLDKMPTLLELSARCIVDNKLNPAEADVGHFLKFYLDVAVRQCSTCGKACFESRATVHAPTNQSFAHTTYSMRLLCEYFFCSNRCFSQRQSQIYRIL